MEADEDTHIQHTFAIQAAKWESARNTPIHLAKSASLKRRPLHARRGLANSKKRAKNLENGNRVISLIIPSPKIYRLNGRY
jgi:hypothetical protein